MGKETVYKQNLKKYVYMHYFFKLYDFFGQVALSVTQWLQINMLCKNDELKTTRQTEESSILSIVHCR